MKIVEFLFSSLVLIIGIEELAEALFRLEKRFFLILFIISAQISREEWQLQGREHLLHRIHKE